MKLVIIFNRISELEQELSHYKIDYIFYKYGIDTKSFDTSFKSPKNILERGINGKNENLDVQNLRNILFKNE